MDELPQHESDLEELLARVEDEAANMTVQDR